MAYIPRGIQRCSVCDCIHLPNAHRCPGTRFTGHATTYQPQGSTVLEPPPYPHTDKGEPLVPPGAWRHVGAYFTKEPQPVVEYVDHGGGDITRRADVEGPAWLHVWRWEETP